jgi:hypothetical protein
LLVSWIAFPLLLLLICLGCGLLVGAVSRVAIHPALLTPLGFAFLIVLGELTTVGDSTTQLSAPLAVAAALAGFLLRWPRPSSLRPLAWPAAAAAAVLLVHAAPIVLSGEPTFAGYVKLDDTATWLAITDRVMEHGRDLGGLAPSSYEATLSFNLASGYPIGSFLPLGMGTALIGRDAAWLFQPYLAVLAVLLALCLYVIAGGLIRSRPLRAAVAAIAAQPALLFGYYLWGGVKELASAMLLALLVALLPAALCGWRSWRQALPAVLAASAVLGVLSFGGGGIWLVPLLALGAIIAVRRDGARRAARTAAVFGGLLALMSLPWLISGGLVPREAGALTDPRELGNLIEPLSLWQAFGIWPVGDFRIDPVDATVAGILIAVVALAGATAGVIALQARRLTPVLLSVALALGCVLLLALGSPWVDAKALATASPAILFAGAVGAGALIDRGWLIEGGVPLAAIAAGVIWSNALAYQETWLAPYDRLAELGDVGELIAGEGPALMTDYEPYGVRHFLREADPEGASELRRRPVPLRGGRSLDKAEFVDIDRFDLGGLLEYRTLVLRRSPLASRPPLPFRLEWRGEHYEVWQQGPGLVAPIEHLSLGGGIDPTARPGCAEVDRLAGLPGVARLAAASRPSPTLVLLGSMRRPARWLVDGSDPGVAYPHGSGSATGELSLDAGGPLAVWVGGSFRGGVEVHLDGRGVGSARHVIDHAGQLTELGRAELAPGRHRVELRYEEGGLRPGGHGDPFGFGPIVISPGTASDAAIEYLDPGDHKALCGRELDWIEALPGRSG